MKKLLSILLSLTLAIGAFSACGNANNTVASSQKPESEIQNTDANTSEKGTKIRIASLKGPTTIGLVNLMDNAEKGVAKNDYEVTMYGAADEISPKLIKGDIDVAYIPCNLASVLYNKTNGQIQVAAINTLGVLYIMSQSTDIKTVADLKGRTIYSTGKGTTVEYVLNYILEKNGLTPGKDVTIEYKSESTEVAALMANSEAEAVAVLPQPYATTLQTKNDKVNIVLDITKEWDKISPNSPLVTGVTVARTEFIQQNEAAFKEFLSDAAASANFVNENLESAAELVVKYGVISELPIAVKSILKCNIDFIVGDNMAKSVKSYLNVLFEKDAKSVGGKLPNEDFYYASKS